MTSIADEITRSLAFEELTNRLERIEDSPALEHGVEVVWHQVIEAFDVLEPNPRRDVPVGPFKLTRDELALIDAGSTRSSARIFAPMR